MEKIPFSRYSRKSIRLSSISSTSRIVVPEQNVQYQACCDVNLKISERCATRILGKVIVNVLPACSALVTVMTPPIISTRRFVMVKPRPVPLVLRITLAFDLLKRAKNRFILIFRDTDAGIARQARGLHDCFALLAYVLKTLIYPDFVNFTAFPNRVNRSAASGYHRGRDSWVPRGQFQGKTVSPLTEFLVKIFAGFQKARSRSYRTIFKFQLACFNF